MTWGETSDLFYNNPSLRKEHLHIAEDTNNSLQHGFGKVKEERRAGQQPDE